MSLITLFLTMQAKANYCGVRERKEKKNSGCAVIEKKNHHIFFASHITPPCH